MVIHVVKKGDSLYSIGKEYNVDYLKIIDDNKIDLNKKLVIGQTIVINDVDVTKKIKSIDVNGYAFPSTNPEILKDALPSLSFLSVFSYQIYPDGTLNTIDDTEIISLAKSYLVLPIMVITNIQDGSFSSDLAHVILNDEKIQDDLIQNIINVMEEKGYLGVNIDFEYVYPSDTIAYNNFIKKLHAVTTKKEYLLTSALAPKTSDTQKGTLYEAHDYKAHGQNVDRVIIMTYEWGYSKSKPQPVAPILEVKKVLDYAITRIPSDKILMGIPNYGYDWKVPYTPDTTASSVSNFEAIDIARDNFANINYDYKAQTPFINYYDKYKQAHQIYFEDARSIYSKLMLVNEYNLAGISYWTITRKFPQNWLVLNSLYDINKYLS